MCCVPAISQMCIFVCNQAIVGRAENLTVELIRLRIFTEVATTLTWTAAE